MVRWLVQLLVKEYYCVCSHKWEDETSGLNVRMYERRETTRMVQWSSGKSDSRIFRSQKQSGKKEEPNHPKTRFTLPVHHISCSFTWILTSYHLLSPLTTS